MIRISVLYPHQDDAGFDMAGYCSGHVPLLRERLGASCKGLGVEEGLAGPAPGMPPIFVAVQHLLFDSVESFQAAFAPHVDEILGDIANYTEIQPTIQISEVRV